jgi:hypothetical protein
MALGDTYATVAELKSRLSIPAANADYDMELEDALRTASEEIERYTNRQFNKATSATARKFVPTSRLYVDIDDFHTTTDLAIKVDTGATGTFDQTWTASDYELEPVNGSVNGQLGWPYYKIRAVGSFEFPCIYRAERKFRVEVTAQWGWANVPAPVKQACLILAAKNFQLKDAPLGVAGMSDFGVVRVQDDRLAMFKVAKYARNKILVG